jgi:hypothetical protein
MSPLPVWNNPLRYSVTQEIEQGDDMSPTKTSRQLILAKPSGKGEEPTAKEEKREDPPTADVLRRMVEIAAYYHAQNRRFGPGRALDDWLAAESEICARYGIKREASPLP